MEGENGMKFTKNDDGYMTSEGVIPHFKWRGIECPVAIKTWRRPDGLMQVEVDNSRGGYPIPERDEHGNLGYALPGGGRIYPESKIKP